MVNREPVDVLMVTYNRPEHTRLALERLLESCDDQTRVWIWHNADHEPTLNVIRSFLDHPRIHEFHHSSVNRRLREPTNWFWSLAGGRYLSKVDDDCLVPKNWLAVLRGAHADAPTLGIVGCWRFRKEDEIPDLIARKLQSIARDHQILRNNWIEGSGYLMKREIVDQLGVMGSRETFTAYCGRAAAHGWINGWYYPFLYQEHMDDPRSPYCRLSSDEDLMVVGSLTAKNFGIETLEARVEQIRAFAYNVQVAPIHPRAQYGWRKLLKRARRRVFGYRLAPKDL